MIIKSDFKDYYDYVGHVYGQDPNVIYVRTKHQGDIIDDSTYKQGKIVHIKREIDSFTVPFDQSLPQFSLPHRNLFNVTRGLHNLDPDLYRDLNRWRSRTIYICGKAYAIVQETKEAHGHLNGVSEPEHVFGPASPLHALIMSYQSKCNVEKLIEHLDPMQDGAIRALHILTKLPVIEPIGDRAYRDGKPQSITLSCRVPNLGELRFAGILPAEQLWQDVSYWMANLIHESPDTMPAPKPPQTNEEKLLAHGFDKRESFRHRKAI